MCAKKADSGWNDPPMLNYSPNNPPPKSRITNKRVAFPLNSSPKQTGGVSSQLIPPVPVAEQDLQRVLDNFNVLLGEIDASERLDLQQKLELLKKSWNEGALPESAKKYVFDISDCLCNRDFAKANEIQLKLTMECGTVCTPWLGLIRRFLAVIQTNK